MTEEEIADSSSDYDETSSNYGLVSTSSDDGTIEACSQHSMLYEDDPIQIEDKSSKTLHTEEHKENLFECSICIEVAKEPVVT